MFKSLLQRKTGKDAGNISPSAAPNSSSFASEPSSAPRPPALDPGEANSIGTTLSTGITPTANSFRELSVGESSGKEKDKRRRGIYGTSDLSALAGDHRHVVNTKQANHGSLQPRPNLDSDLPWQRGDITQQSEHRQVSLLKASYDTAQQSQFTFRAPPHSNLPRLPFQPAPSYQFGPHDGHAFGQAASQCSSQPRPDFTKPLLVKTPSAGPCLNYAKQRDAEPHSPHTPNFPPDVHQRLASVGASRGQGMHVAPFNGLSHGVDLDRDVRGRVVENDMSGFAPIPSYNDVMRRYNQMVHEQRTAIRPKVPENALTSPERVERAGQYAGRKRKRGTAVLPPPAYVFNRKDDPSFNVFHGMVLYPELCYHLVSHLPVEDLVSLYAISKDFHTIIDTRFTTVILSQALKKAPTSTHVFPFRCYGHLCRKDPAARIPHPDPEKAGKVVRKIPSFRWLRMIMYREKVVHAIMALFAEKGIPLPRRCEQSLKKMWFLMDIPDNARRIGFVHNTSLITDADLYFAVCFSVKLDMLLHDPVTPARTMEGRRLIMSQSSMTMLLKVLKGEALNTRWDIMQEYIRWKYEPNAADEIAEDEVLFGVPRKEWGVMRKEFWANERPAKNGRPGKPSEALLRPDQLVLREAIRRGLRFAGHYVRFMQYGYVHPRTLENFEPRDMSRRIEEYKDDEYAIDDVVAGVRTLRVEDGGDPYLDLGRPTEVSTMVIKREEVSQAEREYRADEQNAIVQLYAQSRQERHALGLN